MGLCGAVDETKRNQQNQSQNGLRNHMKQHDSIDIVEAYDIMSSG